MSLLSRLLKRGRGFNLIEMAIGLGIVAAVIGGTWTATSAVRTSYQVNQVARDILTIVDNARALVVGPGAFPAYDWYWLILNGANILPKGYNPSLYTGACGFPTPYNYCVSITVANWAPGTIKIAVQDGGMTKEVCIQLATKFGLGMNRETIRLATLAIGWTGKRWSDNISGSSPWSTITPSEIEIGCSSQTGIQLEFYR